MRWWSKYKGRWKNKQYSPNKPSKYYIKTYVVCDSATGYTFNILTYFGSYTSYNPAKSDFANSENIFEYLLSPLGSGHHVFAGRFYTIYLLIQYLTDKKYFYTGTIQSNQKSFPDEIKRPAVKYQEQKYYRSVKDFLLFYVKTREQQSP